MMQTVKKQPADWWEIQADTWHSGRFQIVSEQLNNTVGSTLSLAIIEADRLLNGDYVGVPGNPEISEVRIYHVIDNSRRYHGVYDRGGNVRRFQ